MAKSTNSSNLFSGFNPPKIDKKPESEDLFKQIEVIEKPIEKPKKEVTIELSKEKVSIDNLVKEEVKKIIEAQDISAAAKIGRPKKYQNSTKVISVRIDSKVYDFVRRKGRLEYDGITDYINQLIKREMACDD